MAYKLYIGDFSTGKINKTFEVHATSTNKFTVDINSGDNGVISLSKRELGSNWESIVTEGMTMFTLIDMDKPWNSASAVAFAGWVNKIDGRIGDVITCQLVGMREYLAARIISPYGRGGTDKPKAGVKFEADTWQGVTAAVIRNAFERVNGSSSQPPTCLGTVSGNISGTGKQRGVRLGDGEYYTDVIDEIRDKLSPKGTEYLFVPRLKSEGKDFIVWDVLIGGDDTGKINWDRTPTTVRLSEEQFNHISFRLSASSENIANRVIGQSKAGDDETNTGADYTVVSAYNGKPLFDAFYNPGVELSPEELLGQLNARVEDLKTAKGSASYEVSGDVADWRPLLGSKLIFNGGDNIDTSGYNVTVRFTGMSFSASNSQISIDVMLPQSRYPILPSTQNSSTNPFAPAAGSGGNGGSGAGGGGGTSVPVGGGRPPGNWTPPLPIDFEDLEPPYIAEPVDKNDILYNRLSASDMHTLSIAKDGKLYAWGSEYLGQLGNGNDSFNKIQTPTLITEDDDWQAVLTINQNSYALKENGSLWAWGDNSLGQTGTGTPLGQNVLVPTDTQMRDIKHIFLYHASIMVIKKDGTLWFAGLNLVDTSVELSESFRQAGEKSDWSKIDGSFAASNGSAWITCLDDAGRLWKGTSEQIESPVLFKDFQVLRSYLPNDQQWEPWYVALTEDNQLYSWGYGNHGDADENRTNFRPKPEPSKYIIDNIHGFLPVANYLNKMTAYCLIVKTDGTLWAINGTKDKDAGWLGPRDDTLFQIGVESNINWTGDVFVRGNYTGTNSGIMFITDTGDLAAFGTGRWGQGSSSGYSDILTEPTKLTVEEGWVRCSPYADLAGFAVLNTDMYITGSNDYGRLGMGEGSNSGYPYWTKQP